MSEWGNDAAEDAAREARLAIDSGRPEAAIGPLREVLGSPAASEIDTGDHEVLTGLLAEALLGARLYDDTIAVLRSLVEVRTELHGELDASTLVAEGNLARALTAIGRDDEAESILLAVLDRRAAVLGEDDPDTLNTLGHLAQLALAEGDLDLALVRFDALLERRSRTVGDMDEATRSTRCNRGVALQRMAIRNDDGALMQDSLDELQACLAIEVALDGPDSVDSFIVRGHLATGVEFSGDLEGARLMRKELLRDRVRVQGEIHPATLVTLRLLHEVEAYLAIAQGLPVDDAVLGLEGVIRVQRRVLGEDHPDVLESLAALDRISDALDEQSD